MTSPRERRNFLSSPTAELIGASLQAVGCAIPVSKASSAILNNLREIGLPVPSPSWFRVYEEAEGKNSPHQEKQDFRTNGNGNGNGCSGEKDIRGTLEKSVNGVVQAVLPLLELNQQLKNISASIAAGSKSAERPSNSRKSELKSDVKYYTPQNASRKSNKQEIDENYCPVLKKQASLKSRRSLQYCGTDDEVGACSALVPKNRCKNLPLSKVDDPCESDVDSDWSFTIEEVP